MQSIRRPRDRRAAVLAATVLSALASAYLTLAGFIGAVRNAAVVVLAVAVVAVIAIGGAVATLVTDSRAETAMTKRLTLRSALDAACLAFHAATGDGAEKFGADLLLVDDPRWGRAQLWTAVHGGFAQHPPSQVAWTSGTGVVGTSWASGTTRFVDLDRLLPSPEPRTDAEWSALGDDTRMGLSLAEWDRTRPYFGTIVAACVFDSASTVVGVAAVYGPSGLDLSSHEPELRHATEALAVTLAGLLE